MDKQLLRNIMLNLLANATKFSAEQSLIQINWGGGGGGAKIAVKDEGIGISKEDLHHLFERFFRAKNAANIQGTGLGLHIVAKYLELMKGQIEVQSELNKGTTFIITIPS
jgi:signal transduction histidine kinase